MDRKRVARELVRLAKELDADRPTTRRTVRDAAGRRKGVDELPKWEAFWDKVDGEDVLRVPGSDWAAFPVTGRKGSRVFQTFRVRSREEGPQLRKNEVRGWLARMANAEDVPPTEWVERMASRKRNRRPWMGC